MGENVPGRIGLPYGRNSRLCSFLLPGVIASILSGNKSYLALEQFGKLLGRLFQMTDDILDVTGDFKELGKSIGKDETENKWTCVRLYGLEGAKVRAAECAMDALAILEGVEGDVPDIGVLKGLIRMDLQLTEADEAVVGKCGVVKDPVGQGTVFFVQPPGGIEAFHNTAVGVALHFAQHGDIDREVGVRAGGRFDMGVVTRNFKVVTNALDVKIRAGIGGDKVRLRRSRGQKIGQGIAEKGVAKPAKNKDHRNGNGDKKCFEDLSFHSITPFALVLI